MEKTILNRALSATYESVSLAYSVAPSKRLKIFLRMQRPAVQDSHMFWSESGFGKAKNRLAF